MVLVQTNASRRAEVRQDLKAGDVLRTNASGTLAIVFADSTQIRLARNSVLRVNAVTRGSPSSLSLQSGRVWGRTPRGGGSDLSVDTPAATAGIRGTEWSIAVEGETTSLQVFSGLVELSNDQGSLSVTGGQAARAVRGQAPTRVALVNPSGREQMLYFVTLQDGLDLFAGSDVPGLAEAQQGDWEAARTAFASVPHTGRAGAIARFADYIAAVQLGEERQVPETNAGDPVSYIARSFVLGFIGELDEAHATANSGLGQFPDEAALYEVKARSALLLGDEASAREAVSAALARDPDDAAALALRSEINLHYAGDPYQALDDAQRALDLQPRRIGTYRILSDVRLERGGTREAMAATDAAIAQDPDNAALYAERAEILISQNRMTQAKADLDRALELDPSLSVVRTGLSDYYLRRGKVAEALDEGLAASADNPAYSRALLQLAEVYYRQGDTASAIQQLDAADRLDPHSPLIPLARTAMALHRYDADQAILSANEALDRFRARGGVYSNLSENRETGSLVSQAFRFLELEGWGRYYGDRVFDTFTPSSYFDQVLNQTPGPFVVRDEDGNFNPNAAEDFDQLSSLIQGVALDPLSVANSERLLQFDNGSFFEAQAGGNYLTEDLRERVGGIGKLNTITLAPFPMALGAEASYSKYKDDRLRPDLGVAEQIGFVSRNDDGDEAEIEIYGGLKPGPYDNIAFDVGYNKSRDLAVTELTFAPGGEPFILPREQQDEEVLFGVALWSHEFGYRDRATVMGAAGSIKNTLRNTFAVDEFGEFEGDIPATYIDTKIDFRFGSVNYSRSLGALDVRTGAEYTDYTLTEDKALLDLVDFTSDPVLVSVAPRTTLDLGEFRGYLDLRLDTGPLILQGQANIVNIDLLTKSGGVKDLEEDYTNFDFRLAAAVEPAPGQWIRLATLRETQTIFPFTFRPVNVIGLKGNKFPAQNIYRTRSHILRWDAQWSRHFFSVVELQDQRHDGVDYSVPDSAITVSGGPVSLQQARIEANWWIGGNLGLRASYALTSSEIRGEFSTGLGSAASVIFSGAGCTTIENPLISCRFYIGDQLPFVPRHAARASVVWALPAPWRVRATLGANYIGGQTDDRNMPLDDFAVADAKVEWEPLDRRFHVSATVLNLFDKDYTSGIGARAPGRTVIVAARARF